VGIKVLIASTLHGIASSACLHERKTMNLPLRKENLPKILLALYGFQRKENLGDHECGHIGY
jgi:hypothetical protein